MTRKARGLTIGAIMAALLVMAMAPGLVGLGLQHGRVFTGAVRDGRIAAIERAGIRQALEGHILFRAPFRPEVMPREIFVPHLALTGLLGAVFGEGPGRSILYFRALAVAGLLLATYAFVSLVLHETSERVSALLAVLVSSGVGWVARLQGDAMALEAPADTTVLMMALGVGRWTSGVALLLVYFVALLEGFRLGRWRFAVGAGVAGLSAALTSPDLLWLLVTAPSVYALMMWWTDREFPRRIVGLTMLALLVASPAFTYLWTIGRTNPFTASQVFQEAAGHVNVRSVLMAFGLPLALSLAAMYEALWRRERLVIFPIAWMVAGFALVLLPGAAKAGVLKSLWVPVGILSGYGALRVFRNTILRRRAFAHASPALPMAVYLAVVFPTNASLYGRCIWENVVYGDPSQGWYYVTSQFEEGAEWLDRELRHDDVVLCAADSGEGLPGWSNARVFVGPQLPGVHWKERAQEAEWFYQSAADALPEDLVQRFTFLARQRITYVYLGPRERRLGGVPTVPWLQEVFRNDEVQIYRVVPEAFSSVSQ